MSNLAKMHRIYMNTLYITENYLKTKNLPRLTLSYYHIANMKEDEILNKLEHMTTMMLPKKKPDKNVEYC